MRIEGRKDSRRVVQMQVTERKGRGKKAAEECKWRKREKRRKQEQSAETDAEEKGMIIQGRKISRKKE